MWSLYIKNNNLLRQFHYGASLKQTDIYFYYFFRDIEDIYFCQYNFFLFHNWAKKINEQINNAYLFAYICNIRNIVFPIWKDYKLTEINGVDMVFIKIIYLLLLYTYKWNIKKYWWNKLLIFIFRILTVSFTAVTQIFRIFSGLLPDYFLLIFRSINIIKATSNF